MKGQVIGKREERFQTGDHLWGNSLPNPAWVGVATSHTRMSCVWRRWAAGSKSLRVRFRVIAAALGALTTTACFSIEVGITALEAESDGKIIAWETTHVEISPAIELYGISRDGGLTWTRPLVSKIRRESDWRGAQSAETPWGTYTIEGTDVIRTFGEQREIAYSAAYLRDEGNIKLQEHDTRGYGQRVIASRPYAIVHDDRTDNVIVAMGLQGAVVGTADGQWMRVAVGDYRPTNFSLIRRILLLQDPYLWLVALALALSFTSFGMVLSEPFSQHEGGPSLGGSVVRSIIEVTSIGV